MKTPTAKRLPSGAWFCRVRIDGQDVSITRSTEKEAIAEAMAIKAGIKQAAREPGRNKTVTKAIDDYISIRQNILSPSTIRGYRGIQRANFQSVMHTRIGTISESRWRSLVNLEAKNYSAKTVKNAWGFMASVIRESTGKEISVNLPQQVPNEHPWLDVEQIPVFLEAIKGREVEIPALLALSSLRRSEIFALTWKDIDLEKGLLYVSGAGVLNEDHKIIRKKETKNCTSRRPVPIIAPLRTALEAAEPKTGPIYKRSVNWLYRNVNRACADCGLPQVGVHGLRHSFASLAYHLKMPEATTMEIGGWADPGTMRKIYTHIAQKDRQDYGTAFTAFFTAPIPAPENQNGNENDNAQKSPG